MDDALAECRIQGHGAFEDDADHPVHGEQPIDPAMIFQAETIDKLHRQISVIRLHHRIVHLHDIRVIEAARHHPLVLEQLAQAARHSGAVLAKLDHLHRHLTIRIRVIAQIHRSRRALAQFANDAVFADCFHSRRFPGHLSVRRGTTKGTPPVFADASTPGKSAIRSRREKCRAQA